jgi:hypothetical protein
MDFRIIDTTPSLDSRSPEFTALRTQTVRTQRFCFEGVRTRPIAASHSHRARLVLILDFGFWTACASARRNNTLYLLGRSAR